MHFGKLLFAALGVYACYITYGVLQEGVYKFESPVTGERFRGTFTILLFQAILNTFFAVVFILASGRRVTFPPLPFIKPGSSFILAMSCSSEALRYVSYPTQVLAKSCKLVPVLLMDVLYYKKSASILQYIHVLLVTAGIVLFRLKPSKDDSDANSMYGLLFLAASLILDGYTGPTQKRLTEQMNQNGSRVSPVELMFFCNFYATFAVTVALVLSGEYPSSITFLFHPEHLVLLKESLILSLSGTFGQLFIYYTLLEFGALTLTTVTTTRKFFTILFSVVVYNHQLSPLQWGGVAIVFLGLIVDGVDKKAKRDALNAIKKEDESPTNQPDQLDQLLPEDPSNEPTAALPESKKDE